jgi:hypothetical protein
MFNPYQQQLFLDNHYIVHTLNFQYSLREGQRLSLFLTLFSRPFLQLNVTLHFQSVNLTPDKILSQSNAC